MAQTRYFQATLPNGTPAVRSSNSRAYVKASLWAHGEVSFHSTMDAALSKNAVAIGSVVEISKEAFRAVRDALPIHSDGKCRSGCPCAQRTAQRLAQTLRVGG